MSRKRERWRPLAPLRARESYPQKMSIVLLICASDTIYYSATLPLEPTIKLRFRSLVRLLFQFAYAAERRCSST